MKKYKIEILILFLTAAILLSYCSSEESIENVPREYLGNYTKVTDQIILGWELPEKYEIKPDSFITINQEGTRRIAFPIRKIQKTKDGIIIYTGYSNMEFESKYEIYWASNHFLYIDLIVPTGIDDDEGKFFLGKFTNNPEFIYNTNEK